MRIMSKTYKFKLYLYSNYILFKRDFQAYNEVEFKIDRLMHTAKKVRRDNIEQQHYIYRLWGSSVHHIERAQAGRAVGHVRL